MKKVLLTISFCLALLSFQSVNGQGDYHSIMSEGDIPNALERLSKVDNQNAKQAGEFNEEVNYVIKTLLRSGRIVFGDSLTNYINSCADFIYEKNPDLEVATDFFVLKNTTPNAFALPNGIIMVTTGLLGQVENEAQLLFILAHEIAHVEEKHGWESFQERIDILKGRGDYKGMSIDDRINLALRKSKKHELEADQKGFTYYNNLGLSNYQPLKVFDVLLYSYLPFDEVPFDYGFFEDSFYTFPDKMVNYTENEIDASEFEDDEEQTHPNTATRKEELLDIIEDTGSANNFAVNEKYFYRAQFKARHENTILFLTNGYLDKAIYNAFLLDKYYGNSRFIQKVKTYAVVNYTISLFSDEISSSGFRLKKKKVQGNTQAVTELLYDLKQKDALVLSKRLLLEGRRTGSDFDFYNKIQNDLDELSMNKWDKLKSSLEIENVSQIDKEKLRMYTGSSKVDKLKKSKRVGGDIDSSVYYYQAFKSMKPTTNEQTWLGLEMRSLESDEGNEDEIDGEGQEERTTILSGDTINLSYPTIIRLVETIRKVKRDKMSDEDLASSISSSMNEFGEKLGVTIVSFDPSNLASFNINSYNKHAYFSMWQTATNQLQGELVPFISFDSSYSYFATQNGGYADLTVISLRSNRSLNLNHVLYCFFVPYLVPFYAVHYATKENFTSLNVKIYDTKTSEIVKDYSINYMAGASGDYLKSHLYNVVYDLAQDKKKAEKK